MSGIKCIQLCVLLLFLIPAVLMASVDVNASKILALNAYPEIAKNIKTEGEYFLNYASNKKIKDKEKRMELSKKLKELKKEINDAKKN